MRLFFMVEGRAEYLALQLEKMPLYPARSLSYLYLFFNHDYCGTKSTMTKVNMHLASLKEVSLEQMRRSKY